MWVYLLYNPPLACSGPEGGYEGPIKARLQLPRHTEQATRAAYVLEQVAQERKCGAITSASMAAAKKLFCWLGCLGLRVTSRPRLVCVRD